MTRIELAHVVAADAPSVALVLAGPAARDLWPQAETEPVTAAREPAYDIRVDPPMRAGVGFTARLTVTSGEIRVGSGRLSIVPLGGDQGRCAVRLALSASDADGQALRRAAGRYLSNVGDVSRARSTAA